MHARAALTSLPILIILAAGCAGRQKPETLPSEPMPASATEPSPREICRTGKPIEETLLANSRRMLQEPFCGPTLWFDGLFGQPDVENARAVSGRVELSTIYTQADGTEPRARLRLKYD